MLSLFRNKNHLTSAENRQIIETLKEAERQTSGEIRVFIESRNPLVNTLERAVSVFQELQMEKTEERNAVLIYVAVKDKEVAIYGDAGIHEKVGQDFWNTQVAQMIALFKEFHFSDGIIKCLKQVGSVLAKEFPYREGRDKNELPDDIIFGD